MSVLWCRQSRVVPPSPASKGNPATAFAAAIVLLACFCSWRPFIVACAFVRLICFDAPVQASKLFLRNMESTSLCSESSVFSVQVPPPSPRRGQRVSSRAVLPLGMRVLLLVVMLNDGRMDGCCPLDLLEVRFWLLVLYGHSCHVMDAQLEDWHANPTQMWKAAGLTPKVLGKRATDAGTPSATPQSRGGGQQQFARSGLSSNSFSGLSELNPKSLKACPGVASAPP